MMPGCIRGQRHDAFVAGGVGQTGSSVGTGTPVPGCGGRHRPWTVGGRSGRRWRAWPGPTRGGCAVQLGGDGGRGGVGERVGDIDGMQGPTVGAGEHVAGVGPGGSCGQALGALAAAVGRK